jgi:VWFA-related protein
VLKKSCKFGQHSSRKQLARCRWFRRRPIGMGPRLDRLALCAGMLSFVAALLPGQGKSQSQPPQLKVDVKVVNVLATVRDKRGQIVSNLGKDDFVLEDDGRPQTITYFSKDTDLPLTLGLLVDTSESQRRVLDQERAASHTFLDETLRNQDKAFVIHFDRQVELLEDLTSSRDKLASALDQMEMPRPQFNNSESRGGYPGGEGGRDSGRGRPQAGGGGTLLYDAIFLASDEVIRAQQGRKALIVLSDGVDHGSKETLENAVMTAQRADAVVYSILFADEQQNPSPFSFGGFGVGRRGGGQRGGGGRFPQQEERPDGKKILERISKETGGRVFEVTKKQSLGEIYDAIAEELRNQYSLGYAPAADTAVGYHKIRITTKQKDTVVETREGYYNVH